MDPRRTLVLTLLPVLAHVSAISAQELDELVAAGRYEEAAAALADAGPEEAQAGATMIYQHAYSNPFQSGAWADAIRGFIAARQVPHLNERQRQMFDFWHASALVNTVSGDTIQPPRLTNEEAIATLEQAYDLLLSSRDYSWGINMSSMIPTVGRMLDQRLQGR
jgi:hypothetical protein